MGVNVGAAASSGVGSARPGGSGSVSTGLASNVVGAMVRSVSSCAASAMTGVAGRGIAAGGAGISISSGMSTTWTSEAPYWKSWIPKVGEPTKSAKWASVARIIAIQNQRPNPRLNRSLAVSNTAGSERDMGTSFHLPNPWPGRPGSRIGRGESARVNRRRAPPASSRTRHPPAPGRTPLPARRPPSGARSRRAAGAPAAGRADGPAPPRT